MHMFYLIVFILKYWKENNSLNGIDILLSHDRVNDIVNLFLCIFYNIRFISFICVFIIYKMYPNVWKNVCDYT